MKTEGTSDRDHMIRLLRRRGIRDERVIAAMDAIPREQFIPEAFRTDTYGDHPISIGFGQTISQPWMTAFMTQVLELRGSEHVLEIGTGCGYHTAVLAQMAASVVTIEYIPELAAVAEENLRRLGLEKNVTFLSWRWVGRSAGTCSIRRDSGCGRSAEYSPGPAGPTGLRWAAGDSGRLARRSGTSADHEARQRVSIRNCFAVPICAVARQRGLGSVVKTMVPSMSHSGSLGRFVINRK